MGKTISNNWQDNLDLAVERIEKRRGSITMICSRDYHTAKVNLDLDVIFNLMADVLSNEQGARLFIEDEFSFTLAVNKEYHKRTGQHGMAIGTVCEAIEDAMLLFHSDIEGRYSKGLEDEALMSAIENHTGHYLYEALKCFIINVNEMNKKKRG